MKASTAAGPAPRASARGAARPLAAACLTLGWLFTTACAMALDLTALWDFADPAASEKRLRDALATAKGDDELILLTQIARSHGLLRDFERARAILREVEPRIAAAGPQARIHHALEWGRTFASAKHVPDKVCAADKDEARRAWQRALAIAREHREDALAIDAIHMFAFVDTAPSDQLRWGKEALVLAQRSTQPAAQRWEASIQNNVGYALHQLGRHDEALTHFRAAIPLREAQGKPQAVREAWWMVAWTLRALERGDEALAIQQRLERENDAAGTPDEYVYEELEALHRKRGEASLADVYARKLASARAPASTGR
jgi:tetratricopeptide (TPR) repeat protein